MPLIKEDVNQKIFKVSEFLDFLNSLLVPQKVIVQGEIGAKMAQYPKFTIFNLLDKDNEAILPCFIWRSKIEELNIDLEEGMEIQVLGYPEIRKPKGEFRFQVERVGLVGEGILKKQFEMLKKKLDREGLFALEFKKPIPLFCQRIGLITSKYGRGAKKDFETHLESYGFEIYFYDVRVEGLSAIEDVCRAIKWFNENLLTCDVLVLTRGGGSWESLRPFNSEEIARAIFASKIPIITGIGHEDDETIADLVADVRASTPTHAAKILTENWKLASINIYEFERNFPSLMNRIFKNTESAIIFFEDNLNKKIKDEIFSMRTKFEEFTKSLMFHFRKEIASKRERLDNLLERLNLYFRNYFEDFRALEKEFIRNLLWIQRLISDKKVETTQFLNKLIKNQDLWLARVDRLLKQQREKLIPSSPILKLKQGYTITFNEFNQIIRNLFKLKPNQMIKTKFYKGQILSEIRKVEK